LDELEPVHLKERVSVGFDHPLAPGEHPEPHPVVSFSYLVEQDHIVTSHSTGFPSLADSDGFAVTDLAHFAVFHFFVLSLARVTGPRSLRNHDAQAGAAVQEKSRIA
jgi:hypothetical protein